MKFVILTNGNSFCTKTLRNIDDKMLWKGMTIFVEVPFRLRHYKRRNEALNAMVYLKLFYRFFARLRMVVRFLVDNLKYISKIRFIGKMNTNRTATSLENHHIDVMFLAGMSILDESILNKIKVGVYNCHPGLVPNVRGVDVIYHAVINSIPPIISIHRVDKGIDTGRIVQAFEVPANVLNLNESYDEVCEDVLDYGAERFSDFIIDYVNKSDEVKNISCSFDYPVLNYCRKVKVKNAELFACKLKKVYNFD